MAFPVSPSDGDTHSVGSTTFIYKAATNQWKGVVTSSPFNLSSGGGSVAAPTNYSRFTIKHNFNDTKHAGGSLSGYVFETIRDDQFLVFEDAGSGITFLPDSSNYGTGVAASSAGPNMSGYPQFCSLDDFLATNPTYEDYGAGPVAGQYYCASNNTLYYTNDAGTTWDEHIPTPVYDGSIILSSVGKYRVNVKHNCFLIGYGWNSSNPIMHSLVILDDEIKANYADLGSWEIDSPSSTNRSPVWRTEFDSIIDVTQANSVMKLGMSKLGDNINSTSFITIDIESLF